MPAIFVLPVKTEIAVPADSNGMSVDDLHNHRDFYKGFPGG